MENFDEHVRNILFFYFKKGKNATDARKKIVKVYGEDVIKERQCQKWFTHFREENFSFKDAHRSGRPVTVDIDTITDFVKVNRHSTVREIASALNMSVGSVYGQLKSAGFIQRLNVWVPHELKEIQKINRIDICDQLMKREEIDPFLKRIITGDEKWIVYNNVNRKRSWSKKDEALERQAKADIHQKKVLLSIWWDWKGPVYYELLPKNKTINSEIYCEQLQRLSDSIQQKRPELVNRKGVVFHHDNARPHISLITRQKLLDLRWDVLPHPSYSPDLAPSDFHLFRSLQNSLNGIAFSNEGLIKEHLERFFAEKNADFYLRGIMKLPQRWQKVIDQNGEYIID